MSITDFLKNKFQEQSIQLIPSIVFFDEKEMICHYKMDCGQNYIRLYAKTDIFTDDLYIQYVDTGITVRRTFKNTCKERIRKTIIFIA